MSDWTPPACRIRTVPHLGERVLTPALTLATHAPYGRAGRGLWLRMRRLLPPDYWHAWLDVPRAYRSPLSANPTSSYSHFITRLHEVADNLHRHHVEITVAQAALWVILRADRATPLIATEITVWQPLFPDGSGWSFAAAGFTPNECARTPNDERPQQPVDTRHGLTLLRGHHFPHPDTVPTTHYTRAGGQ